MKIALYTSSSYPHLGGMTSHMQELESGIKENGHSAMSFGFPIRFIIDKPKKVFHQKKEQIAGKRTYNLLGIFYLVRETFFILFLNFYLLYIQAKNKIDIYIAEDVIAFHGSFLLRKLLRKKVALTVHGYYVDEKVADNKLSKDSIFTRILLFFETSAYKKARLIFSVDTRIKEYIQKIIKSEDKIVVLKNFVDINLFKPMKTKPNKKFTLLCPRRFVEKNGVVFAVQAMKYLSDEYELLLAGEGQTISDIKRVIEKYNLKNVKLLGGKDRKEMPSLINSSDAVIIPSISVKGVEEATSISALEAMSCGKSVIASDIGGLKEIILNKITGLLVKDKNPEDIANAIKMLAKNVKLREKLGKNARKKIAEEYSHIQSAREYIQNVRRL